MAHINKIKVMVQDDCSVGCVVRNILREIIHRVTVVGLRSIVHKMHILLAMLGREFLVSV